MLQLQYLSFSDNEKEGQATDGEVESGVLACVHWNNWK
jgi:hypothetical protein